MIIKKVLIFVITLFITVLTFSQTKVDTAFVVIDSLYFQSHVICDDIVTKTRCTDTIYSIISFEDIKNGFLGYIDHETKNRNEENIDYSTFIVRQKKFESYHPCKASYNGFEFPLQTTLYIKMMYINFKCDSLPVMEGEFFQNQKNEFYYCGIYKEYDIKGHLKVNGQYYFSKEGERSISIPQKGEVQYGTTPRKFRNEEYGGAYIKAKKDGIWTYYKNGRLIKTVKYKKGEIMN